MRTATCVQMPHLPLMQWNFKDELCATSRQVVNAGTPETTYYVYDAAGQRARKITESQNGARKSERFYLGGFEIYREYNGAGNVTLARETLHVMDDKKLVTLVETKTVDHTAPPGSLPSTTMRYQFNNHLGSASLELDERAAVVAYEEYYPFGSTSYQAGRTLAEVSRKRYRYTNKERDEETGLYYHGARYFAAWLGRWTSCDPKGLVDGTCLYRYCSDNPIVLHDPTGTQGGPPPGMIANDVRIGSAWEQAVVENFGAQVQRQILWRSRQGFRGRSRRENSGQWWSARFEQGGRHRDQLCALKLLGRSNALRAVTGRKRD